MRNLKVVSEINTTQTNDFLPYERFIKELRESGIKTFNEYISLYKNYPAWPACPHKIYSRTWNELTGKVSNRKKEKCLPYELFIKELHASNIRYRSEYWNEYKLYPGWPSLPQVTYKKSWNELMGKTKKRDRKEFLSLHQFVKQLRLSDIKTIEQYRSAYKWHSGWPREPTSVYQKPWNTLLGKVINRKKEVLLPAEQFINQLRKSKIRTIEKYKIEYKLHSGWPSDPVYAYSQSWTRLVGKKRVRKNEDMLPVGQFRDELSKSGVRSFSDYRFVYKNYFGWPADPASFYNMSWVDLIGKEFFHTISLSKEKLPNKLSVNWFQKIFFQLLSQNPRFALQKINNSKTLKSFSNTIIIFSDGQRMKVKELLQKYEELKNHSSLEAAS